MTTLKWQLEFDLILTVKSIIFRHHKANASSLLTSTQALMEVNVPCLKTQPGRFHNIGPDS